MGDDSAVDQLNSKLVNWSFSTGNIVHLTVTLSDSSWWKKRSITLVLVAGVGDGVAVGLAVPVAVEVGVGLGFAVGVAVEGDCSVVNVEAKGSLSPSPL